SRALGEREQLVSTKPLEVECIGKLISEGGIVARWAGKCEFGPRALGGRSLLANPRDKLAKEKLNLIKGRQSWRPVAPIVHAGRLSEYFDGPESSPWMNYSHSVREEYRDSLPALEHPDYSTRVQALDIEHDPFLFRLLTVMEALIGFPILVNTSFNRS